MSRQRESSERGLTMPTDHRGNPDADPSPTGRRMRLRYAGRCGLCSLTLAPGTHAFYDSESKSVTCDSCAHVVTVGMTEAPAVPVAATVDAPASTDVYVPDTGDASASPAVVGTAGASARRNYDRRHQAREERIRAAHPRIGDLLLAVSDDPQSTRAWATGAVGEERLAARLDAAAGQELRLLHDRRIPGTRANIDHIAIAPSGVYVIDAKRYKGRPDLRVEGGLLRPRVEKLVVGSRDCTKLVDGVLGQTDVVRATLAEAHVDVPVFGVLCFVEADWPLIGGDFTTRGVYVVWPKKLHKRLTSAGPCDEALIADLHQRLASGLPAA